MPYRYDTPRNDYALSIAELMARRGDIAAQQALATSAAQARAAETRGQIWGNAVQSIGQTVGAIPQQMQQQKDAAQDREARGLQMEAARGQLADQQRQREDRSTLQSAMSSRMAPEQVKAQLQELGRGDLIQLYDQANNELETSRLTLKQLRDQTERAEADYAGTLALNLKRANFDPLAVEWALSEAERDGHDVTQLRQLYEHQPDALPTLADQIIGMSPAAQKALADDADRTAREQREQREAMEAMERIAATNRDDRRQAEALEEQRRHNRAIEGRGGTAGYIWATDPRTGESRRMTDEEARAIGATQPQGSGGLGGASVQLRNSRAAAALNGIERLKKLAPERMEGPIGIAQGLWEVLKGYAGFNTEARQYQALTQPTAMQMAAAIQGAANLSDNERKAMAEMLGSIHTMDYQSQIALLDSAADLISSGTDVEKVGDNWIPVQRGAIRVNPNGRLPGDETDALLDELLRGGR